MGQHARKDGVMALSLASQKRVKYPEKRAGADKHSQSRRGEADWKRLWRQATAGRRRPIETSPENVFSPPKFSSYSSRNGGGSASRTLLFFLLRHESEFIEDFFMASCQHCGAITTASPRFSTGSTDLRPGYDDTRVTPYTTSHFQLMINKARSFGNPDNLETFA
jgi:hypothetical protein